MWVERLIEGDRNARIKLDAATLSVDKAAKKILKHSVWVVIAAATGGAWILYFNDAPTVTRDIFYGTSSTTVYFFIGLLTATTYTLAGWAREQVCTYMCPWPRFQSAMFDEHTLIVTYQNDRGEPRGHHHRGDSWAGRGHCVNCNLCVAVCPTGIDIRDGQQLECIGCGLCADACNSVMEKVDLPRGLIGLDTRAKQDSRAATGRAAKYRLVRARTAVYAILVVVVSGLMAENLINRATLDLNVLRDRNPLFVLLSDGSIHNGYTVKAPNMSRDRRDLSLSVRGIDGVTLVVAGQDGPQATAVSLTVGPDSVGTYRVLARVPPEQLNGEATSMTFVLIDRTVGDEERYETIFRGPPS